MHKSRNPSSDFVGKNDYMHMGSSRQCDLRLLCAHSRRCASRPPCSMIGPPQVRPEFSMTSQSGSEGKRRASAASCRSASRMSSASCASQLGPRRRNAPKQRRGRQQERSLAGQKDAQQRFTLRSSWLNEICKDQLA